MSESTAQLIVKNDHLQVSQVPFSYSLLIYDGNQLQDALTRCYLHQFLLVVCAGQGHSHRQQRKGGVSIVAEELDERTVAVTNLQDDSFEQLHVVLHSLDSLCERVEAFKQILV